MRLTDKFFSLFKRDALLFISNLFTGIVIARELGPEYMGVWTVLLLIPGYAEAFFRLKFEHSSVYFINKKKASFGEVTFLLHCIAVLVSIAVFVIYVVFFEFFYSSVFVNTAGDFRDYALWIFIVFPLRLFYLNYSYLLIAREEIHKYNKAIVIHAVFTAVLSLILIVFMDWGILGALIGMVVGLCVSIIYSAIVVQKVENMVMRFNYELFIEIGLHSRHHYVGGVIGYFQYHFTNLICALILTPAFVAFYSLARSIADISTRMVPVAITTVLYPKISSENDGVNGALTAVRSFRVTLLILSISTIFLLIFIKPIVYVLYGSEYYSLIEPFCILITGVVLVKSSSVFNSYFSGCGRADLLPKIAIFPLMLQLLLSYHCVQMYGINGAAYVFLISSLVLFLLQIIGFVGLSKIDKRLLFPTNKDLNDLLVFVARVFRLN